MPESPSTPTSDSSDDRIESIADAYLDRLQSGRGPDREALLARHADIAEALARRLDLVDRIHGASEAEDEPVPESVGPYRILDLLGEGGMGLVFLAEQSEPVRRRVALKIMKPGMDTKAALARFESERQALALMEHPNIAKVLDAGATERDRPYFVMEYVPGLRLTEYCDGSRLSTAERLAIFVQVCDAVQHAHQKGIIHRDLKPSNLLVAEVDGRAVPRVIDFGVAKAMRQRLTDRTFHTVHGRMVGTVEYMSPEQAEMTSLDVDTRTDIYSLGVVLYELLTGTLPFPSAELREAGIDEVRRRIREDEPPRPSTKVGTTSADSAVAAEQRRTTTTGLVRTLRGDLDWITLRALEKDRNRRYATASELAEDIRRYLRDEPVLATPPSTVYRLRKFARKNRRGVAAALLVLLALVVGLVGTSSMWLRAERAKDAEELAKKEAVQERDAARDARAAEKTQREEAERQREAAIAAGGEARRRAEEAEEARRGEAAERVKAERARVEADEARARETEAREAAEAAAETALEARAREADARGEAETAAAEAIEAQRKEAEARARAEEARREAEARVVAGEAISRATIDRGLAVLLALEALGRHRSPDTASALSRSLFDGSPGIRLAESHREAVLDVEVHPDGRRVLSASADGTVRMQDEPGRPSLVLRGHTHWVHDASFRPDGEWIVTAGGDGAVRIWRTGDGEPVAELLGHGDAVRSAEFDPAGERLVTAGADGTVRVWDIAGRRETASLRGHVGEVNGASFSPDGAWIVSAGADGSVRIWDAASGEQSGRVAGLTGEAFGARFGPAGERVVIAGADPTVRIWRREGGELIGLTGHTDAVRRAAFGPDGRLVVSASLDRTCRVWDVDTRREVAVLRGHDDWVLAAAFGPDGRTVVTGGADRSVRRFTADWSASLDDLVDRARAEAGDRLLTDEERRRFIPWGDGP